MEGRSDIQQFYKNQTIFITGGTGFLGKLAIEKLLRICYDLNVIYMLVRPKKDKTADQRFKDIFSLSCFDRLKAARPNFHEKIRFVSGDTDRPGLGLGEQDRELLRREVTVVLHAAANVKFDQDIRQAANSNIRAVRDMLQLAREMPLLKAFVHVSTAYSNAPRKFIGEKFYEPGIKADSLFALIDVLDDKALEEITPELIQDWPNTYAFTKCVAEDVINTEGGGLPIAIVRPAIIVQTAEDPAPGWVDNFYGMVGAAVGVFIGAVRCLRGDLDAVIRAVPCDFVANNVLAAPWDLNSRQSLLSERAHKVLIYNYVASVKTEFTLRHFMSAVIERIKWIYPTNLMFWYPKAACIKSKTWFKIRIFLQHTVPAYVIDFVLMVLWKKTIAVKKYQLINKHLALTSYFILNTWHFDYDNVETLWRRMSDKDRIFFKLNMDDVEWDKFWLDGFKYGRKFLLNDPLETLPQARRKIYVFAAIHYLFLALMYYLLFKLIHSVFSLVF